MCSSLSNDGEIEVFVKHRELLHIAQGEIGSSNVCNQPSESVCEGENYTTNVELKPNVDQIPQYEDKNGSNYKEAERDSSEDSDFIDDEYLVSDDDDLYDNYVDVNEEWVGPVRVGGKEDKEKGVEDEYRTMNDVKDDKNICDDDIRNLSNDDEEEINRDKPRYLEFVSDTNMANPKFSIGLLFTCATEFRAAVRECAIKNGRNVKFVKNEKDKVRVVCSKGCP